jgi:capsular polysaccharide biosynthesis protein
MEDEKIKMQKDMYIKNENEDAVEIDLLDLLNDWRRHILPVIIVAIVGAVLGFLFTRFFVTPLYTAESSMFVVSASSNSMIDLSDLTLGSSLAQDYVELVNSRTLLERVAKRSGQDLTVGQLKRMLSVSNVKSTRIIVFKVTSADPEQAKRLANIFVEQAVVYLPEVMHLSENLPTVIDTAVLPKAPYNINYTRNVALGFVIGLVLALGVCTVLYLTNDTINSADDVERYLGIIPMATVPENGQKLKGGYGQYTYTAHSHSSRRGRSLLRRIKGVARK